MSFGKDDRKNQPIHGKSFTPSVFRKPSRGRSIVSSTHSFGDKDCSALTGRTREPSGIGLRQRMARTAEFLIALCRHSDQVLETFLLLADVRDHLRARKPRTCEGHFAGNLGLVDRARN